MGQEKTSEKIAPSSEGKRMSRIRTLGFGTRDQNRPWIEEKVATQSVQSEKVGGATGIADSRHSTTPGSLQQRQRVVDQHGRAMGDLRISVTDRCNLRCAYCMPEENYTWLPKAEILTFEEITRLVDLFAELGVTKIRITGGGPLLRSDLHRLVKLIAERPAIHDLAITTNGILLGEQLDLLRGAGLRRITVSLDTLRPDRFRALTRRDGHEKVIEAIRAVRLAGFRDTKIDTVVIRGVNDAELADLIEFGK